MRWLIRFFFFFSSRRRHTRLQGDWSSDACSSDLNTNRLGPRLRFVFRNFPLTELHLHAEHAAEAAEAAGAQGKFWEMHDRLFERQFALEDDHLIEYAQELGLDAARLERELAAHTYKPKVRDDFMSGVRSGVNGTPTF